jgi:hypothetical protein
LPASATLTSFVGGIKTMSPAPVAVGPLYISCCARAHNLLLTHFRLYIVRHTHKRVAHHSPPDRVLLFIHVSDVLRPTL